GGGSGDAFLRFIGRTPYSASLAVAGRLRETVRIAEEGEALCGADPDLGAEITGFSPYCVAMMYRGLATAWLGCPVDGAEVIERTIEIVRRRRDAEAGAYAHSFASEGCGRRGGGGGAPPPGGAGGGGGGAGGGPPLPGGAPGQL